MRLQLLIKAFLFNCTFNYRNRIIKRFQMLICFGTPLECSIKQPSILLPSDVDQFDNTLHYVPKPKKRRIFIKSLSIRFFTELIAIDERQI
ncbi:hypothetical protein WM15_24825 [Burkholderia ubonensis]|nr:hypothetical protein WM15_24825 [Burkholderia ubonensis]